MIQGLWYLQVESIIVVKLGKADADSYKYGPMAALLSWWETIKKKKHGNHGNDQQQIFTVFSFSQWNARDGSPGCTRAI